MGLLDLLGLGSRSLAAAQLAQATVGNNAANVATPGFSRRRVSLAEAPPTVAGGLSLGSGVQALGLERLRDAFLDSQWRLDQQALAFARGQASVLEPLGALLAPADGGGLGEALDQLWAAFGDLAARPEDLAVRSVVLAQAQRVADALHATRDALDELSRDSFGAIQDRVAEINELTARLARLNAAAGARPDDPALADERDRLVDALAGLVGVRTTLRDDGTLQVVAQGTGIQLVDGTRAAVLTVSGNPTGGTVGVAVDGAGLAAPGGELGGLLRMRNSSVDGLPWAVATLDALAGGLVEAVNRVHAAAAGLALPASLTGTTAVADSSQPLAGAGLPFAPAAGTVAIGLFDATGAMLSSVTLAVDPATDSLDDLAAALSALPGLSASVSGGRLVLAATDQTQRLAIGADPGGVLAALGLNAFFAGADARTIAVNPALLAEPALVAAAQPDLAGGRVSPGDPRAAAAMAALGTARLFGGATQSAAEFLGAMGGAVGASTRSARAREETLGALVQAVEARRQSVSGVNLDEELADMVRYQHAYEAGARYVKVVDQMIQTVLELL
jgi:flagellar hook-associated protein 1 FlgK